jgi:hypothetical protein
MEEGGIFGRPAYFRREPEQIRSCIILQGSVSTKDTDNLVEVDGPDVPKCLYVINMFRNDLKNERQVRNGAKMDTISHTLMQRETRVGNFLSWIFRSFRFSAADLRLRGVIGFLNGSVPDALAQVWQR